MKDTKQYENKSEISLSEEQKCLIGGLKLLNLEKDAILVVCLMLRSEPHIMEMLEWLDQSFKNDLRPTQEQVMSKTIEISKM